MVEIDGKRTFGMNSGNLAKDTDKNLSREWRDRLGFKSGRARSLFHAEVHALIRAHEKNGGKMPEEIEMHVDRYSCATCQKNLPILTEQMGIKKLTLKFKDGRSAEISDGTFKPSN